MARVRTSSVPQPTHPAWGALVRGRTLDLYVHPRSLPGEWRRIGGTERRGQVEDWVCSMPDRSRLHVHVFRDGTMRIHRDRWDPDRGPLHKVAHVALETTAGRIGLAFTALRFMGYV